MSDNSPCSPSWPRPQNDMSVTGRASHPMPQPYVLVHPTRTNGMAIASLVLGILWIYWLGSILALVFGYVAKKQIRESGGLQQGGGLATAGIVLGWVGVGVLSIVAIVAITGYAVG